MNELKMGKWFKLPVDCSHIMDDTETPDSSDSIAIDGCVVLTDHHVEKVEIAINTYDKNQELIAKQAKQIEVLREALQEVLWKSSSKDAVHPIAREALSATAGTKNFTE